MRITGRRATKDGNMAVQVIHETCIKALKCMPLNSRHEFVRILVIEREKRGFASVELLINPLITYTILDRGVKSSLNLDSIASRGLRTVGFYINLADSTIDTKRLQLKLQNDLAIL